MAASLILAMLAVPADAFFDRSETVEDCSFYAIGWQCTGDGCRSNPRQLGENLRFKVKPSLAGFGGVARPGQDWHAMLECSIARDRLVQCEISDDSNVRPEERTIALQVANALRVEMIAMRERSPGRHAVLSIDYETGDCPTWSCAIIPPPPPPPVPR